MDIVIFTLAWFFGIPLAIFGAWKDCYRRSFWWLCDLVFERPSVARILARSMVAQATADDWTVRIASRHEAVNNKLGVELASYDSGLKVWFANGGDSVELKQWEQNLLRAAIRRRIREGGRTRTLDHLRRQDAATIALAERFIEVYERAA